MKPVALPDNMFVRKIGAREVVVNIFSNQLFTREGGKVKEATKEYLKDLRLYAHENSIPISCVIELTQACNFNCKHCYCTDKHATYMDFDLLKVIVDKLTELGCLFFTLTGGEVFLSAAKFKNIYQYIKEKGNVVSIMTNGSLLTEDLIPLFKKYPPENVNITMYGVNEQQYAAHTGNANSYRDVIDAMSMLKRNGIKFSIKAMAMKSTAEAIKHNGFDKFCAEYDTDFEYGTYIMPTIGGDKCCLQERLSPSELIDLENHDDTRVKHWRRLVNKADAKPVFKCTGGVRSLFVDYQGNASICAVYRKPARSLKTDDVFSVWNALKEEKKRLDAIYTSATCASCKYQYLCRWCPGYSSLENGVLDQPTQYFCELSQKRVKDYRSS